MQKTDFLVKGFVCLLIVACAGLANSAGAANKADEKMNAFIDHLISQMTVEEKAGQLTQYSADMDVTGASLNATYRETIGKGGVGSIFNAYTPHYTSELQKIAVEKSRLKIPLLFGYDVIHGHKTIFPIPLAESCSWDLGRIEESSHIAAREAAADGVNWTFAPMVDVSRDPRWGRVMEGAGEDPWLGSRIAEVRVRGFQGAGIGATDSVMACVKHFAAYGAPIAGREYNSVDLSERTLRTDYLPPYKAAVDAGVATVMTSFNDIAGVPSTANEWLLTKILRDEWKFKGFVVTDYTGINELVPHGLAANDEQAAMQAINAGVDMDMQGGTFARFLPDLVRKGKVKIAQVNAAVRRVLEVKYKLGLFTDPYRFSNEKRAAETIFTPENLDRARDIGRRSIVLLQNENQVLPLKKSGTIALIGPYVTDHKNLMGMWFAAGDGNRTVSLAEGVSKAGGPNVKILKALGANLLDNGALRDRLIKYHYDLTPVDPRSDAELISEAQKTARDADVVVLALGEAASLTGEAAARTSIRLPENQLALLRAVKETGKPVILVLFNGRPLVLEEESRLASAMVESWFLGTEAGDAIADVLFGDYNPSAKLTMSFPVNEGQIPIYYSSRPTGRPIHADEKYTSRYLDAPNEPFYPFGYGLSYTHFIYSAPRLDRSKLRANGALKVRVTVKNAGAVDGEEITQLYVSGGVASVTQPSKRLRGFQKTFLRHGESRDLEFTLTANDIKFYNRAMKWVAEPSEFKVMVGGNSHDVQDASFRYVK